MPIAPPVSFQAFGSTSQSNSAESQLCSFHFICMAVSYLVPYRNRLRCKPLKQSMLFNPFQSTVSSPTNHHRAFQWTLGERLYQNLNHKLTARLLFFALLSYKSPVFDVIVFTPCIHRLVLLSFAKLVRSSELKGPLSYFVIF